MSTVNEKNLILKRAQGAVLARDFSTAARLYKQLLTDDPSNVDYLREIGAIYVKAGEDEKAVPYYEQIITFYPHYIDAMNSLGAIFRRLKRYEDSIAILQRAVDEGRQSSSVNYNLGFTYKEMGNYDDAIDAFEMVIGENPSDVLAHNHLGCIYLAKKQYQKSIAAFKRGLQIDQNHPILNYNLACCYRDAKQYNDAIRYYEAALRVKPGWIDAIKDYSDLLVKCQKTKEASDLVKHSIELHPNDSKLLSILGKIYLEQFDYESAAKIFKRANNVDSQNLSVLSGLADALEKSEKPQEALDAICKAVELEPENKEVKKQYVHTLLSAQEYDSAQVNVQDLYSDNGEEDPQVLDLYGQYYICVDEEEKAADYFDKIGQINKQYKDHLLSAASRYSQKGNYSQAEKFAKEYMAKNIQSPEGYNMLGSIYSKAGNKEAAIESFTKSQNLKRPNVLAEKQIENINNLIKQEAERKIIEESAPVIEEENPLIENPVIEPVENKEDEAFDFGSMGDNVPMGEALLEDENDFFEELDKELENPEDDFFEKPEGQSNPDVNSNPLAEGKEDNSSPTPSESSTATESEGQNFSNGNDSGNESGNENSQNNSNPFANQNSDDNLLGDEKSSANGNSSFDENPFDENSSKNSNNDSFGDSPFDFNKPLDFSDADEISPFQDFEQQEPKSDAEQLVPDADFSGDDEFNLDDFSPIDNSATASDDADSQLENSNLSSKADSQTNPFENEFGNQGDYNKNSGSEKPSYNEPSYGEPSYSEPSYNQPDFGNPYSDSRSAGNKENNPYEAMPSTGYSNNADETIPAYKPSEDFSASDMLDKIDSADNFDFNQFDDSFASDESAMETPNYMQNQPQNVPQSSNQQMGQMQPQNVGAQESLQNYPSQSQDFASPNNGSQNNPAQNYSNGQNYGSGYENNGFANVPDFGGQSYLQREMEQKVREAAHESARYAMDAAMDARKMAQQLADDQKTLKERIENLDNEYNQIKTENESIAQQLAHVNDNISENVIDNSQLTSSSDQVESAQENSIFKSPEESVTEINPEADTDFYDRDFGLINETDINLDNDISSEITDAFAFDDEIDTGYVFDDDFSADDLYVPAEDSDDLINTNDSMDSNISPEETESSEAETVETEAVETEVENENIISEEESGDDGIPEIDSTYETETIAPAPACLVQPMEENIEELDDKNSAENDSEGDSENEDFEEEKEDTDSEAENFAEIELFKKLRSLCEFVPDSERQTNNFGNMRTRIEYIISKMSGKHGLLKAAEEYVSDEDLSSIENSNENSNEDSNDDNSNQIDSGLLVHVLGTMKSLATFLEDQSVAQTLCSKADDLLGKIDY